MTARSLQFTRRDGCVRGRVLPFVATALVLLTLTACGSGGSAPAARTVTPLSPVELASSPRFAQGPVGTACTIHNRKRANAQRCGCIQAAADLTLSQGQQQRAVRFFAGPELLQQMKLSDTPANERFWDAWAQFAETAELMCKDV